MVRFRELTAHHVGMPVRFADLGGVREGRLMHAQNPVYDRLDVRHWYLVMPDPRGRGDVALSLQWLDPATEIELPPAAADPLELTA